MVYFLSYSKFVIRDTYLNYKHCPWHSWNSLKVTFPFFIGFCPRLMDKAEGFPRMANPFICPLNLTAFCSENWEFTYPMITLSIYNIFLQTSSFPLAYNHVQFSLVYKQAKTNKPSNMSPWSTVLFFLFLFTSKIFRVVCIYWLFFLISLACLRRHCGFSPCAPVKPFLKASPVTS